MRSGHRSLSQTCIFILLYTLFAGCDGNTFCLERKWTIVSGSWSFSEDDCSLRNMDASPSISTIWIGDANSTNTLDPDNEDRHTGHTTTSHFPKDFTLKFTVDITSISTLNASTLNTSTLNANAKDDIYIGILLRTNTVYTNGYSESYMIKLIPSTNMIEFGINKNEEWTLLSQAQYTNGIEIDKEYNINIEVDHHHYKISVNDENEIIRTYDTALQGGLFGISISSNIMAEFKNIQVNEFDYTMHKREHRRIMKLEAMKQSIDPPILPFNYSTAMEQMEDTRIAWMLLFKYNFIDWHQLWDLMADEQTIEFMDDMKTTFGGTNKLINFIAQYNHYIDTWDMHCNLIDYSDYTLTVELVIKIKMNLPVFGAYEGQLATFRAFYEYDNKTCRCVGMYYRTNLEGSTNGHLTLKQLQVLTEYIIGDISDDENNANLQSAKDTYFQHATKPKSTAKAFDKFNKYKYVNSGNGNSNFLFYAVLLVIVAVVILFSVLVIWLINQFIQCLLPTKRLPTKRSPTKKKDAESEIKSFLK